VVDDDTQVGDIADYLLFQYKDQQLRLDAVALEPDDTYTDAQWTRLLSLEVLQRISATVDTTDGRTVTTDGLVRGVSLEVRPYRWVWKVSTTAAPGTLGNFTLDDTDIGVLSKFTPTDLLILADYYQYLVDNHAPYEDDYFDDGITAARWYLDFLPLAGTYGWSQQQLVAVGDWTGMTNAQVQAYPVATYATLALF
jgi:hypothetical protein